MTTAARLLHACWSALQRLSIEVAREDRLMPPAHARRLAEHFENAELVWVDDSATRIPVDQPGILTTHLKRFLEQHAR